MMTSIMAELTASMWKINVCLGDSVQVNDELAILESMKMEIAVVTLTAGVVHSINTAEGAQVTENQVLFIIRSDD